MRAFGSSAKWVRLSQACPVTSSVPRDFIRACSARPIRRENGHAYLMVEREPPSAPICHASTCG